MNKLVTIVINTYNRKDLLSRAIDSAYRDKYENKDIIVVDDCSTDDISSIIKKYKNRENFKYIRNEKNMGLAHSRNVGWQNASGEYIAFLDDDDEWIDENKLTKQVNFLEEDIDEKYFLVATSIVKIFEDGGQEDYMIQKPSNIKSHILRQNGVLYPSTVLIRKKCIELVGGFDTRFSRGIDSDVYRNLILNHNFDYEIFKNKTVLYTHLGIDSITIQKSKNSLIKIRDANAYLVKKYMKYYFIYPEAFLIRLKNILITQLKILSTK